MLQSFLPAFWVLLAFFVVGLPAIPQYGQGSDHQLDPELIKEIWQNQPVGQADGPKCDELELCVRCVVFNDYFSDDGSITDCDCSHNAFTEASGSNGGRESRCEVTLSNSNCRAGFDPPTEDGGPVEVFALSCPDGEAVLSTDEGTYRGEVGECDTAEEESPPTATGYTLIKPLVQRSAGEQPHGRGKLEYGAGDRYRRLLYQGGFKCGRRHGKGYLLWSDGSYYAGDFVDGARTGQGKMTYANGDVYEGSWNKDEKHGEGVYSWVGTGLYYVGTFADGKRDGEGTISSVRRDEPIFEGISKENKKASGFWDLENGDQFQGELDSEGRLTGDDVFYSFNCGNYFEGQYRSGKRNGSGKFVWMNGDSYEGNFVDGYPHGESGVFQWADGQCLMGNFENGQMTKQISDCSIDGRKKQKEY